VSRTTTVPAAAAQGHSSTDRATAPREGAVEHLEEVLERLVALGSTILA